jgi:hypothetical protein
MKLFLSTFLVCLAVLVSNAQTPISTPSQCSNVSISNVTTTSIKVSWTKPTCTGVIVVVKPSGNTRSAPSNANAGSYSGNTTYGSGTNLGNSNYIVYYGTTTAGNITVNGLSPNTNYEAIVYSYNYGCTQYLLSSCIQFGYLINTSYGSGNSEVKYTLATEPTNSPSISLIGTPGATNASLAIGGSGYSWNIMSVRNQSLTGYNPVDGIYYHSSPTFGSGDQIGGSGTQNFATYFSSPTATVNLTNLQPATLYFARVYAANGVGGYSNNSYNYSASYNVVSFSTYNTPPTLNALSNYTICEGATNTTVTLSGVGDGSTSETQTVSISATSDNTTLIPNPTISFTHPNTSGSLVFKPNANQSGTAIITVTANDGGPNNFTTIRTFTVVVKGKPASAGAISTATTTLCRVKNGVVFSIPTIANATNYNWSLPSGATIVSGANSRSITVNFNTTVNSHSVTVFGSNSNGCGNGAASGLLINFDAVPTTANAGPNQQICNNLTGLAANTPSIGTGAWTFCSTGLGSISSTSTPNANLQVVNNSTVTSVWSISNGVCPVSSSTVVVTNIFGSPSCNPDADFLASNLTPCVNTPVIYYNTSIGATSSTWNFGPTATPSVSSASNSVSVIYSTTGPKTVTLTIGSVNGPDTEIKTSYVDVISVPSAPTAITGNTTVCQNSLAQPYFINSVVNATDYFWSFASGVSQNTGGNTNAITANFSDVAQSGNIGVYASNACGNSSVTNLSVTVNPLPSIASSITGSNTVCQGVNSVVYTAENLNNAISYTWDLPDGASITNGTNTKTITVNYSNIASSGTVSVYGTNACGDGEIAIQSVTVNPLPGAAGLISGSNAINTCPLSTSINYSIDPVSEATTYHWSIPNGYSIVSGLNSNSINIDASLNSESGNIKVVGKNACGAGDTSSILFVNVSGLPTQDLCVVTVDSSSTRNEIFWQKNGVSIIDSFKVYRVKTLSIDTLIGTVAYSDLGRFIDTTANPNVTSYTYKISAIDLCGNESVKSSAHQTIHLQSIYSTTPKKTDLSWNLYVGASVDNYRVLRDTNNSGNWQVLANTLAPNVTSYTDLSIPPTALSLQYRVDVIWTNSCDANAKVAQSIVNTTKSNTKDFVLPTTPTPTVDVGINNQDALNNSISVYPNPTKDEFQIDIDSDIHEFEFEIYNQLGSRIYSEKVFNSNQSKVNMNSFGSGVYSIVVKTKNGIATKRIFKL